MLSEASSSEEGVADPTSSCPDEWPPPHFLSWVLFGPMSDFPDKRFFAADDEWPARKKFCACIRCRNRGSCRGFSPSLAGSHKLLAPPSAALSRYAMMKLRRAEREEEYKRKISSAEIIGILQKSMDESTAVIGVLKTLVSSVSKGDNDGDRNQLLEDLREDEQIARDEGDMEMVAQRQAKWRKLLSSKRSLRVTPVVASVTAIADGAFTGGGSGEGSRDKSPTDKRGRTSRVRRGCPTG